MGWQGTCERSVGKGPRLVEGRWGAGHGAEEGHNEGGQGMQCTWRLGCKAWRLVVTPGYQAGD